MRRQLHGRAGSARSGAVTDRCWSAPARAAARRRCWWSGSCRPCSQDGCAVDSILAITFTEKAAAQLDRPGAAAVPGAGGARSARARPRRRGSRPSTASARGVLRTHALAAGLDPEFRVLDGLEAERLAIDAFDRALRDFVGTGEDPGRLALLAAYTPDKLADMVRTAYAHLRSQGKRSPRLPEMTPPRAVGPARGAGPGGGRGAGRAGRRTRRPPPCGPGPSSSAARRCWRPSAPDDVAEPAEIKQAGLQGHGQGAAGPGVRGLHRGARRPTWPSARTTASTTTTCWCAS